MTSNDPNADIESAIGEIIRRFESFATLRDHALAEGRQIVRLSANAVRATHRGDDAAAERLLSDARDRLEPLVQRLQTVPEILNAGHVQDAMREYAEAHLTAAIVRGRPLPGPGDLGVADAPYLNALAEAASELRRQVLDLLRAGDLSRSESLLATMDEIYTALLLVDFPDAVTGGLRRTVDALRAVLERTRGDVTAAVGQHRLSSELRRLQAQIEARRDSTTAPGMDDSA